MVKTRGDLSVEAVVFFKIYIKCYPYGFVLSSGVFRCSCMGFEQSRVAISKNLDEKVTSLTVTKVLRRSILPLVVFAPIFANANAILAAPMQEMREPDVLR